MMLSKKCMSPLRQSLTFSGIVDQLQAMKGKFFGAVCDVQVNTGCDFQALHADAAGNNRTLVAERLEDLDARTAGCTQRDDNRVAVGIVWRRLRYRSYQVHPRHR